MSLYSLVKIEYSLGMKESILLTQTRASALFQTSLLCVVLLCLAFVWVIYFTRDDNYTEEENLCDSYLLKIPWALASFVTLVLFLQSLAALC